MISRRFFLGGALAVAAPAVIRTPGLLMPVRTIEDPITSMYELIRQRIEDCERAFLESYTQSIYGDGSAPTYDGVEVFLDSVCNPQVTPVYISAAPTHSKRDRYPFRQVAMQWSVRDGRSAFRCRLPYSHEP